MNDHSLRLLAKIEDVCGSYLKGGASICFVVGIVDATISAFEERQEASLLASLKSFIFKIEDIDRLYKKVEQAPLYKREVELLRDQITPYL